MQRFCLTIEKLSYSVRETNHPNIKDNTMVNKVILIGNLGSDPELRSAGEHKVCDLSIATKRRGSGENNTDWHTVTCWNKTAEIVCQYLNKGAKVYIEGSIQYQSYEKDGIKRKTTKIIASQVQFLDSKKSSSSSSSSSESSYQKADSLGGIPF